MKVTLICVIISAALFLKSCNSEDGFTREGDHWLNNGNLPNSKEALQDFVEYEMGFKNQDAAAMVEKYTDDCVYISQDLGILRGKEAIQTGYQEIFKSGKARVKIELLKANDAGTLGEGYLHFIAREYFFDKDNKKIGESIVLVVLKQVEDGYKSYLKAEITDLSKPFVRAPML